MRVCASDGFRSLASISGFQASPNSVLNLLMPVRFTIKHTLWLPGSSVAPRRVMTRVNNSLLLGQMGEREGEIFKAAH